MGMRGLSVRCECWDDQKYFFKSEEWTNTSNVLLRVTHLYNFCVQFTFVGERRLERTLNWPFTFKMILSKKNCSLHVPLLDNVALKNRICTVKAGSSLDSCCPYGYNFDAPEHSFE